MQYFLNLIARKGKREKMKKNLKEKIKKGKLYSNKGITLITLVITIVILIILAAVAINLTLGDNGLFYTAKEAASTYANATVDEEVAVNSLSSEIDASVETEYSIYGKYKAFGTGEYGNAYHFYEFLNDGTYKECTQFSESVVVNETGKWEKLGINMYTIYRDDDEFGNRIIKLYSDGLEIANGEENLSGNATYQKYE
jgi:hypothetical protein